MKKLLLILLLILMLCSCGVEEEPVLEEPSGETAGADIIRPEKPEIFEEKKKTEDEIYYESLDREGKNMYTHISKNEITYDRSWAKVLSGYGILSELKNIRFIDDWYYSAVFSLKKVGVEEPIEITLTGIY